MRLCVLAFITLATATAATVTTKSTTLSKEEFVRLITSKLKKRAQNQNSDKCVKEVCADEGDSCNSSIICRGFMECIRGECGYSSFGDPCNNDNKCYGSSLFCHDDRCREFGYEGGYCVDDYDCRTKGRDLYCSATKSREIGTCKKRPQKVGDECFYRKNASYSYCPTGTYCSATEESGTGVCRPLPSKIGDSCNLERMLCTPSDELYCDNSTKKCRNLPKLNEECYYDDSKSYYVKCFKGYYCDDSMLCKEKKGLNEECKYNGDNCKEGFYCAHTNQGYMCKKLNPTKGEYCDDTYLKCQGMLACQNNICVNKGYECKSQYDCPDSSYFCDTDDHKCKGGMKIKEGEKCYRYGTDINSLVEASLQCEEGLVCGEDQSKYKCLKSYTKIESIRYCESNRDCGYDANCECDDINGRNMCVPIPSSSKKLQNLYFKFEEDKDNLDAAIDYYDYLMENHLYIHAEYRCQKYFKNYNTASSIKASALVTIVLAFLALF